jgi:hypothetical protein
LPQLSLHWWDTLNDRQQTAVLPEQRLRVLPSTLAPPAPAADVTAAGTVEGGAASAPLSKPAPTAGDWNGLTFLFASLWLVTLALLFRRQRGMHTQRAVTTPAEQKESEVQQELKQACTANDAARVRRALSRWLREFGPAGASGSLLEFATQSASGELRRCLLIVDGMGFRPARQEAWNGEDLWNAFSAWRKQWLAQRAGENADVTDLWGQSKVPE